MSINKSENKSLDPLKKYFHIFDNIKNQTMINEGMKYFHRAYLNHDLPREFMHINEHDIMRLRQELNELNQFEIGIGKTNRSNS